MNATAEEIRAAAFRLKTGFEYLLSSDFVADYEMVAAAYLAEHPADDGEAIDEAWLRSVGFKAWDLEEQEYDLFIPIRDEIGWECRLAFISNGFYAVRLCEEQEFGVAESVELLGTRNRKITVSRGDVRRLTKALCIELKGNQ